MKFVKLVNGIAMILLLFFTGCSSSKITTTWKAKNTGSMVSDKIMVIGIIGSPDRLIQEKMETHILDDLKRIGYTALASLNEYGPNGLIKGDTAGALAKLDKSEVDAVLTIVLLNKEKEQQYIASNYMNRLINNKFDTYNRIFEPGYYVTNTKYFWETNLYNLKTKQLLYSVQTQSFNPDDTEKLAHDYGRLIIKKMLKEEILKNRNAVK